MHCYIDFAEDVKIFFRRILKMNLEKTVEMMLSEDYKERFKAEY